MSKVLTAFASGCAHEAALGDHRAATDSLVGIDQDLAVALAPHQSDRQPAAQLPARGLVADAAIQARPQPVQKVGRWVLRSAPRRIELDPASRARLAPLRRG